MSTEESGECESSQLTEGWYRYDNIQYMTTNPPQAGQCGSWNPIWLRGIILHIALN